MRAKSLLCSIGLSDYSATIRRVSQGAENLIDQTLARETSNRAWIDILIGAIVVVVFASPVLFTDRVFFLDSTNFLWLGSVMRHSVAHGFPPTFFLNTNSADSSGIFNPLFAFYGGPLFVLFAILIAVCGGSVLAAFDVLILIAFSSAYGGAAWISRQCGLEGRLVHFPAIAVISAAYYLTNLYGRGDVPEFVAVSVIPLAVASATHLVRAPKWTFGPTALLILSVILFTGSHNITLLWGTLIGAVLSVALVIVTRPKNLPFPRLAAVAGLMMLAASVNAWFLVPDIAFSGTTAAAVQAPALLSQFPFFNRFTVLFSPGRHAAARAPALFVQAPVWFLGWSVACGIWIWSRRSPGSLRRIWTTLVVAIAALFLLIIDGALLARLPSTLRSIQFAYRLNAYVLLLAAGLVLVSLLALQQQRIGNPPATFVSALAVSLVVISAVSVATAVWQEWVPGSCPAAGCAADRASGLTPTHVLPATWYAGGYYTNAPEAVVPFPPDRTFEFSPELVDPHGDRLDAVVDPPPGTQPFVTNIMAGPQLVSVGSGIERVGRSIHGFAVVRRVRSGSGPIRVVIETADNGAIRAGRWISFAALIGVGLVLSAPALRRRRGPGRGRHQVQTARQS